MTMLDPTTLKSFIRLVSKEKDLPPDILKEAIEHAILAASRKQLSQYRDAVADLDLETGKLTVTVTKTVADTAPKGHRENVGLKEARKILGTRKIKIGEEVRIPIDPSEFGRIAAQSARQMVMQRLRDAERYKTFNEFKDKEGIMVTGIVQRFDRRDVILNIGRAEGVPRAGFETGQEGGPGVPVDEGIVIGSHLLALAERVILPRMGPDEDVHRARPELLDGVQVRPAALV